MKVTKPFGEPRHEHDCPDCVRVDTEGDTDWYVCPTHETVIGRYGAEEKYWSMPIDILEASGTLAVDGLPLLMKAQGLAILEAYKQREEMK